MDNFGKFLEDTWHRHLIVGGVATALGVASDKLLTHKKNSTNLANIAMSFATITVASMGVEYKMGNKKPDRN